MTAKGDSGRGAGPATYWDHHLSPPPVAFPDFPVPTPLEEYLFDLRGFVVLRGALSAEEVEAGNSVVNEIPRSLGRDQWWGWVHREDMPEHRGISYQQIYEAGAPFEALIDHPSYLNYVLRFLGSQGTFDENHGPLFVDESFFLIRGPGEAIPPHSGGHTRTKRTEYRYHNGRFACGQVNVLIAFGDIGPGDGATMVIPGSHKSNIVHPAFLEDRKDRWGEGGGGSFEGIPGAVEVFLQAGDALVFVDACAHGSARRIKEGERRICVYRYGSSWNRTRWGYVASDALCERLGAFAASVVRPERNLLRVPPGVHVPKWEVEEQGSSISEQCQP